MNEGKLPVLVTKSETGKINPESWRIATVREQSEEVAALDVK